MRGFHRTRARTLEAEEWAVFMKQNIEITEQPRKANLREPIRLGLWWNRGNELFRKTNDGSMDNLTKCPSSMGANWTRVEMNRWNELFRKSNARTIESLMKVKLLREPIGLGLWWHRGLSCYVIPEPWRTLQIVQAREGASGTRLWWTDDCVFL